MTALPAPALAKILVVDDTPDNLRLLTKILEAQNYVVMKALNGQTALRAISRNPPDLILLDVNMPELNGYEVCRQLRASVATHDIPVIFISALDRLADKIKAFDLGGQDYITKPFQESEVLARVRNQLVIRQQRCQLEQEIENRRRAETQVRRLNLNLERLVQARTLELHQVLEFELALKHIAEQVRDSLDRHRIMQGVVETLVESLMVLGGKAVIFDRGLPTTYSHWRISGQEVNDDQILAITDCSEVYEQLQAKICFAFCSLQPQPISQPLAILACPIYDDQKILGDLWLFRPQVSSFGEAEMQLVQQVANQCAIALRQARLYEAAQVQVQELEHLNQLKNDFLSTVSHELRTPITSMKLVIQLLTTLVEQVRDQDLVHQISQPRVVQYLEILRQECERELALVEDLLNLQYIEAGTYAEKPTLINTYDFLCHLIEPFEERTFRQGQTLTLAIDPALPALLLDRLSLNRIITELLNNACKYTPAGGTIAISAGLEAGKEPPTLEVSVVNTGVEIPQDQLSEVFKKFYRIPNHDPWKYGGTGLGLALVKGLVEQIGGRITVESGDGRTRFRVFLPASPLDIQLS